MFSVGGPSQMHNDPRRSHATRQASAHRPSSVNAETMAATIQGEKFIDNVNLVAKDMDRHLSHVRPSQYEPFLTHGSSPESALSEKNEVVEFYNHIHSGIESKDPNLSQQLRHYLFLSLQLHDGGDRFKDVQGDEVEKHKRALLVHGLVQRDAHKGFTLLNQLMSSYDEDNKKHLRQLMVEMQPIRIALPVRGIDPTNLKMLVDAIKNMRENLNFDSGQFKRFKGQLLDALPRDTDQLIIDRINYLLADFETFNREEQRSRLAEIRLMITSSTETPFKRKDPTYFQKKTREELYSFTSDPTFNQDYNMIDQLEYLLLTIEKSELEEGAKKFVRESDAKHDQFAASIRDQSRLFSQLSEQWNVVKDVATLAQRGSVQGQKLCNQVDPKSPQVPYKIEVTQEGKFVRM